MSSLRELRQCEDRTDLALLLKYQPKSFCYILYGLRNGSQYREFCIAKKNGGVREIVAPTDLLKLLQRKTAKLLNKCLQEIEHKSGYSRSVSHGFKPQHSIATNAHAHIGKKFVVNADFSDFFDSFTFWRVKGFFEKNEHFRLSSEVAITLAQICCFNNKLPQGAPTSPVVTNLIGGILDHRLVALAKKHGCAYSRYADDITFSSNKPVLPRSIAEKGDDGTWVIGPKLRKEVRRFGFEFNPSKTRVQYYWSRQEVTGLSVNKKVSVSSSYRRNVRAMVAQLLQTGNCHQVAIDSTTGEKRAYPISIGQLHGRLAFIDQIITYNRRMLIENGQSENVRDLSSSEKTYAKFLFYKEFYAPLKTIIICEGKTDYVYLNCAIQSHKDSLPELINNSGNGGYLKKYKFFTYANDGQVFKPANRLLGLGGGSPDIKKFINGFRLVGRKIKAPGRLWPVVIIIDNDKESRKIFSFIKEITGRREEIDGTDKFYQVHKNLYLVVIPQRTGANQTVIEQLFPQEVLQRTLNGKTFSLGNTYSKANSFGKADFADKVVFPDRKNLDFSGFLPLLERVEAAVHHYRTHGRVGVHQ